MERSGLRWRGSSQGSTDGDFTSRLFNLKRAVAGLKTAHMPKITAAFELSLLTLTMSGLRRRKAQNPLRLCTSAPLQATLTAF
jgi:hypothetical protein